MPVVPGIAKILRNPLDGALVTMVWSPETRAVLKAAGWYPGRREVQRVEGWRRELTSSGGFEMTPIAERVLQEFGGIRVDQSGAGIECARGNFEIDPMLAQGEEDRFDDIRREFGLTLFPLGEAFDGHGFLAIDLVGKVYLVFDEVHLLGRDMEEAIDALLLGRRARVVYSNDKPLGS